MKNWDYQVTKVDDKPIMLSDVCKAGENRSMYLRIQVHKIDGSVWFDADVLCDIVETDEYLQIRFLDPDLSFHSKQSISITEPKC